MNTHKFQSQWFASEQHLELVLSLREKKRSQSLKCGQYSSETLSDWADTFLNWQDSGKTIYCYFDNDESGYAAQDALKLEEKVNQLSKI
ncbi:MAG: DUF72 domain-containing protein [Halothece sp.]